MSKSSLTIIDHPQIDKPEYLRQAIEYTMVNERQQSESAQDHFRRIFCEWVSSNTRGLGTLLLNAFQEFISDNDPDNEEVPDLWATPEIRRQEDGHWELTSQMLPLEVIVQHIGFIGQEGDFFDFLFDDWARFRVEDNTLETYRNYLQWLEQLGFEDF